MATNHNRIDRKLRRRIPFAGGWWLTPIWYAALIILTPLSLITWLQPGGQQTSLGNVLIWVWTLTAALKLIFSLFVWIIIASSRAGARGHVAVGPMAQQGLLGASSLLAFSLGRIDIAVPTIYL